MNSEQQLTELITTTYEAVGEPDRWTELLATLGNRLGAAFVLSAIHRDEGLKFTATAGLDTHYDLLLKEQFNSAQTNPLVAVMPKLPVGVVTSRASIYADKDYFSSALYHELFRPQQLAHRAVACAHRDDALVMPFGVLRPNTRDDFAPSQLALLDRLLPHLRRALTLHLHLNTLAVTARWQAEALDRLPFGMAMISSLGRVMVLNAAAQRMIEQNDGLGCGSAGLYAAHPDDTKALQACIKKAIATGAGDGTHAGGAMRLPRPSRRRAFQLVISPYRSTHVWPGMATPAATVYITDPEQRPVQSTELLRRLYRLTWTEARLAALLMQGIGLTEAADQLGVTHHTVRTHVKNIFLKTGVKRQGELVRLLLTSAAYLSGM